MGFEPVPRSVWGDGFHDDDVTSTWRVRSWQELSFDEHAVLFPRLVSLSVGLPAPLRERLGAAASRGPGRGTTAAIRARDERVRTLLTGILSEVEGGAVRDRSAEGEFLVGFGAGFHPGYLWPEAACAPVPGYTACWLGHVARGRSAMVPLAVAQHLLDGGPDGAEGALRTGWGNGRPWERILAAARARVSGLDRPFCLAQVVPSPTDVLAALARRALR